jgi:hypothetical protein
VRDGLRATVWASASLETVVPMALDGLGIAVMPPAIIENKTDAREKSCRLNTTIKLPNLDDVASWPTAADDTGPQNRCHRHKGRTRVAWIAQYSLSNFAKMTIGQRRAGCICSALFRAWKRSCNRPAPEGPAAFAPASRRWVSVAVMPCVQTRGGGKGWQHPH